VNPLACAEGMTNLSGFMSMRVLVLEDQQLLRDLLCSAVRGMPEVDEVRGAGFLSEARTFLGETAVDLMILDLELPDGHGMQLLDAPGLANARVVIVTGSREAASAREALLRGVDAFICKDESYDVLLRGIEEVLAGRPYYSPKALALLNPSADGQAGSGLKELSGREREILIGLASSESVKEAAARLAIAVQTVKTHRLNVMRKLGIHDVAGLTRFAVAEGLVRARG
jgi:DNA-binding NarL/FixJ family response regulator